MGGERERERDLRKLVIYTLIPMSYGCEVGVPVQVQLWGVGKYLRLVVACSGRVCPRNKYVVMSQSETGPADEIQAISCKARFPDCEVLDDPQGLCCLRTTNERNHVDFLCTMRSILPSRSEFIQRIISALENHFRVKPMELDEIKIDTNDTHEELQYSTKLMTLEDLGKALAS